jgi:hypothetical protein
MDYRIIDAHCHIFPDKIVGKAVQNIGKFYNLKMSQNGLSSNLIEHEKIFGVEKFIVNSTATKANQVDAINNFILNEVKKHEEFLGLITLHPDMEGTEIDKYIKFAIDNKLKGIKLHPDFQHFYIDDTNAYKIYERAEGVLPILFHTGDDRYEESRPVRMAKIAKKFKNLHCIAAHFGGYSRWEEVNCYQDIPNVFFDTSSSLFKLPKETAIKIINMLGIEKFMFGTDYPMWEISEELNRFFNLGLSENDNKSILYNNAVKIFNINV